MRSCLEAISGVRLSGDMIIVDGGARWILLPARAALTGFLLLAVFVSFAANSGGYLFFAIPLWVLIWLSLFASTTRIQIKRRVVERRVTCLGFTVRRTEHAFPRDARIMIRRIETTGRHRHTAYVVCLVWSGSRLELFQSFNACSAVRFMRLVRRSLSLKVQPRVDHLV